MDVCGKCEWFDPKEEINGQKGCCMRFIFHVEESTVRAGTVCFREKEVILNE